jgi:serine/threonine protein kinase
VVHRDLKARNVLISTVVKDVENLERSWAWHVKITDFGLSKLKEAGSQYSTLDVGTRAFMAPEVFNVEDNKDKNYTKAADVYSYAMIFFEVLTGKLPFEGVLRGEIFERIKKGERPNLPSEAYCPEYLSAFIGRCWATDAKERPEFPDICQMLVYCKELILRDSFPSPLICIVENDAQKLSSFLGPKWGIQLQVKWGKHFGNWISQWQDFDKAFLLFSNAAKQKDPEALYRLGLCF